MRQGAASQQTIDGMEGGAVSAEGLEHEVATLPTVDERAASCVLTGCSTSPFVVGDSDLEPMRTKDASIDVAISRGRTCSKDVDTATEFGGEVCLPVTERDVDRDTQTLGFADNPSVAESRRDCSDVSHYVVQADAEVADIDTLQQGCGGRESEREEDPAVIEDATRVTTTELQPMSGGNGAGGGPHAQTYGLVELPCAENMLASDTVLSLKQVAASLLAQVVAEQDATISSLISKGKALSCWGTGDDNVWSCASLYNEFSTRPKIHDAREQSEASLAKLATPRVPKRVQYGPCKMLTPGGEHLHAESSKLLKMMFRANAHVTLLAKDINIPSIFKPAADMLPLDILPLGIATEGSGGPSLRQLSLPSDVLREDDARLIRAPARLSATAVDYLRDLQKADFSVIKAAMSVPSMWNHSMVMNEPPNFFVEHLQARATPKAEPASLDQEMPDVKAFVGPQQDNPHNSRMHPADEGSADASSTDSVAMTHMVEESKVLHATKAPLSVKLAVAPEDRSVGTDYFVSDDFLRCNWSKAAEATECDAIIVRGKDGARDAEVQSRHRLLLRQLARPALWDLIRKKLLRVDGALIENVLDLVNLEMLEAVIYQQFHDAKQMSLNPSAFVNDEITEACSSLRQAVWLHTLCLVSMGEENSDGSVNTPLIIVAKILQSVKYKLVLGPANWRDLRRLYEALGDDVRLPALAVKSTEKSDSAGVVDGHAVAQPPQKKQKILLAEQNATPVRVLCSIQFLEKDELLDELCTEQHISFIERDLPSPIDMLIDERNCICVLESDTFQAEAKMRQLVFSLARLQVQVQKCWVIIVLEGPPGAAMEEIMLLFYAALVQFRIEIQTLLSCSTEETSRYARAIVDECAEVALSCHRILPRMWFERPFLLEEESQYERFLVSTQIINHYSAQSLLHKISMGDLFTKSLDELTPLIQNAVTGEQLGLLWSLVHQNHGLNVAL